MTAKIILILALILASVMSSYAVTCDIDTCKARGFEEDLDCNRCIAGCNVGVSETELAWKDLGEDCKDISELSSNVISGSFLRPLFGRRGNRYRPTSPYGRCGRDAVSKMLREYEEDCTEPTRHLRGV